MKGFLVLRSLTDLEDIVAMWPIATLENTAKAHFADATTHLEAWFLAGLDVDPALVMSVAEAESRIAAITARRRTRMSFQTKARRSR